MESFKILDCTLRDGGYYTTWDFDKKLVEDYCVAMESLPIEYIEIGYRSIPMQDYMGEYFYCQEYLMERLKRLMPNKKLTIILNEKDVTLRDIDSLLDPCKPYITLVRIAVAPDNFERSIELAKVIKGKQFEVAMNVMYMSTWQDNENLLNNLSKINGTVDYFYMVDSFGGVNPLDVSHITRLVRDKVDTVIGFHGHNNLELGLINSLEALKSGCGIIDSTITGMGRGAGNLKTELLLSYLSAKENWSFSFNELSHIVSQFSELQNTYSWGTNLPYMISGANSLAQKEVMSWLSKKRYSISGVVNALRNKVEADSSSIQKFNDRQLKKTAIIIGGGESVTKFKDSLTLLIEKSFSNNYVLIHAGVKHAKYFEHCELPQYYALVGNEGARLQKIFDDLENLSGKVVLAPSPRKMGTFVPNEISAELSELNSINFIDSYFDSPLSVSIQIALELGVEKILFAGFDGYKSTISRTEFELTNENQQIFDSFRKLQLPYTFITPTKYLDINQSSIFSML